MVFGVETAVPTKESEVSTAQGHLLLSPRTLSSTLLEFSFSNSGDPTLYEPYWKKMGDRSKMVISGDELMSYFSNSVICVDLPCCSLRPLIPDRPKPISVVAAAPFYSSYPMETEFLQSRLYKWSGDANRFDEDEAYIEVVTSPNNPDGSIRGTVVNLEGGKSIHDLAYYWPQYTPITHKADHDVMLFTFSKATGHAGSRMDGDIHRGEQHRCIQRIPASCRHYSRSRRRRLPEPRARRSNFFEHGRGLMSDRWERLREVVMKSNGAFSLPEYPQGYCKFTGEYTNSNPAFAWLRCKEGLKCEDVLREECGIMTRGGTSFGVVATYARVSMLVLTLSLTPCLEGYRLLSGTLNGN
ncbi:hypothetical protein F3Y22_tig00112740pilonHSYRG00061 [Hibiscus syriacus]|uniref:Alliinase C-terminal domain-containing protein n=1 Tax=Hibiscus syriacus TaxID=106335 RepID=A0A6A2WTN7_HIBSY|nr:hypothetical protein F3Y22_tig00112740pilonHSYRG00061 [Hibiscus syriacus]